MTTPYSVVFVTVPDAASAEKIGLALLDNRLAACVNQLPNVVSRFWWEGKIDHADELLLLIKTRTELMDKVLDCVKRNHPYSVPEIIGVDVTHGLKDYLNWIAGSTRPKRPAANHSEKQRKKVRAA